MVAGADSAIASSASRHRYFCNCHFEERAQQPALSPYNCALNTAEAVLSAGRAPCQCACVWWLITSASREARMRQRCTEIKRFNDGAEPSRFDKTVARKGLFLPNLHLDASRDINYPPAKAKPRQQEFEPLHSWVTVTARPTGTSI